MSPHILTALMIGVACLCSSTSFAAHINDPANDFLPSYTGPHNADLDVLEAEVFLEGSSLRFTSHSAAAIGTTSGGVFVWGIDRGAGFATFPVIAPGVTFDAVAVLVPGGSSFVRDLATNVDTPISNVSFSGADLSAVVPLSAFPSLGAAPSQYTVNLWPRSELSFTDDVISDFAPDNSNAAVTVMATVPEPTSLALLGAVALALLWVGLGLRQSSVGG